MDSPITTTEADAIIESSLPLPATEHVPLAEGIGRTLTHSISSDRDLPPYSRAMMDGIAFQIRRLTGNTLSEIAGLHAAGDPPPGPLAPGQAWEIMTGACIPPDCDTVVPYEHLSKDHRTLLQPIQAGQFIHLKGSDARAGDILVPAERRVGPAEIAIAASVGLTTLAVAARPRIALISSGDEAVPVGDSPQPWQIRRSNGPMLEAILRQLGHAPILHHHVPDHEDIARKIIGQSLEQADLIVLCGGISKGKRDFVRPLIGKILGNPDFHGVLQRPGRPFAFWSGPPLVFALPGNPVSVLATFTRYVLPTLVQLEGREVTLETRPMPHGLEPLPQLTRLLALNANGHPLLPRNSGDFVSIAGTTGFIEIPSENEPQKERVRFYPCDPC